MANTGRYETLYGDKVIMQRVDLRITKRTLRFSKANGNEERG